MARPRVIYEAKPGTPLDVDRKLYGRLAADTINYGLDEDGAGCHDLLGTRCDPYVHKLLNGEDFDLCCHSNLVRAVAPYHLTELDVHDVLNVFQVTGLTPEGKYFVKPSA